ncbi:MATE family efflux transporter [Caldalkalibacillus salinus]|uniref:MATE family efflux transporter n=1 Tax=Caldalkalibacillus salinus TaxID=2803787 RepID=UPI0019250975|nr:MATE family efflux transporter [Caldalkalibacillus salinus]
MKQHDFTTGGIFKKMLIFSAPIMLTNMLQVSYQFADSLWVGNLLGANALGAVAISSTVVFTVLSFIIGLNNATLTVLSQQKGKDEEDGLRRYLNAFVVLLSFMSVVLATLGFLFSVHILRLLGTPEAMMSDANTYLRIIFVGMVFLVGYNFIGTVLRALGDSRTPLRFVLAAVILNIGLNPLFISGLNLGISGAAYSTIAAQGASFLYGMFIVLRHKLAPFQWPKWPRKKEVLLILNLGIPSGLQMSVISAGIAAVMSVVTTFGEGVVAGFSAAQRIDSIFILPAMAIGTAVNSMAGQNIGVHKWDRVEQIAKYGTWVVLGIMAIIASVVYFVAPLGIQLFITEPAAVAYGASYLQLVALFYPFLGINFVLNGVVRASGAMYQVLVLNIISFWVLRYPLTYLFSSLYDQQGIAVGIGASFVLSSMFAYLYYRYGGWRKKVLFEKA